MTRRTRLVGRAIVGAATARGVPAGQYFGRNLILGKVAYLAYPLAGVQILAALGLAVSDLRASWRLSPSPTKTQLLGLAVSKQRRFAAIRYPSDAAQAEDKTAFNYVIFRDSIEPPALLKVLTGKLVVVQQVP